MTAVAPPEVVERLALHGQSHVLRFLSELDERGRRRLLEQVEQIEWSVVAPWLGAAGRDRRMASAAALPTEALRPAAAFEPSESERRAWHDAGESILRAGRVAAFTVAGGQGTRLGWSGPKGTYPGTVVTGKPLFRVFAEQILAAQKRYGVQIPWLVMTSPMNDAATRAFIADNNCFGLQRRQIAIFPQAVLPSLDLETGDLMLESKGSIALNPDGHGGSLRALASSGVLDGIASLGVDVLSYFQVDNPLVHALDPAFIGLHADPAHSSGEMSSKAVEKRDAGERVGVFCATDGGTRVVEYSDLPAHVAAVAGPDGRLHHRWGSIAVHLLGVPFVQRLTSEGGFALPYHVARKKVPYLDVATGDRIDPSQPNAIKLETFVFDAIPLAERPIVLATDRAEEFAPIKNASGEDSRASSFALQTARAARWLEAAGVRVPRRADGTPEARIEISPLTACDAAELARARGLPREIRPGEEIAL